MDNIKEAFDRVKGDINFIYEEISEIKESLRENREGLIEVCEILKDLKEEFFSKKQNIDVGSYSTDKSPSTTVSTDISTNNGLFKSLNMQNMHISIGNEGVPTDRQTDQQTDQQTNKGSYNQIYPSERNSIENAANLLDSLDSLKKEIRIKFKRLTEQELTVFSAIYQDTDEKGYSDYKRLAQKLNLTESSIRDYVRRLINKGIPLDKIKLNNKQIQLSISPNLKKIANLSTILQLREL